MVRYKNINHFDQLRFTKDLHLARWGRGLSMESVAKAMKKSKATISRWESGRTIPTVSDFILICWFFDLNPLSYFIANSQIEKTCKMFDEMKQEKRKAKETIVHEYEGSKEYWALPGELEKGDNNSD